MNQPVSHRWRKLLPCTELPLSRIHRTPANGNMTRQVVKCKASRGVYGCVGGGEAMPENVRLSMSAMIELAPQRCNLMFKAVDLNL